MLGAQATTLHGVVRDAASKTGVPFANVFERGTMNGALTDSSGHFTFTTSLPSPHVLIVKRVGFRDALQVVNDASAPVLVELGSEARVVPPVSVQAGRYVAADEPGATLTPLEIVTIPGTAADVNRAIQTLPGVQQVDEGTGLFVRGGDYTETRVYLNDGLLLNPAQLQNAAGTFVGTLDPFLLDGIYFASGGFGVKYGDALSAVADLHTQRRPEGTSATLSAGLAAIGANIALAGPSGTGFRFVANRNDLQPVLSLNGSPRQFSIAPRGSDRTASAYWDYRSTGRVAVFATEQGSTLGALTETPSVTDTFSTTTRERAVVAAWSDVFAGFAPRIVLSSSAVRRTDGYGAFELATPSQLTTLSGSTEATFLDETLVSRSGGEVSRAFAAVDGSIPADDADEGHNARTRLYRYAKSGTRTAWYQELEWRPTQSTRVTMGARQDRGSFSRRATTDPRISATWRVNELASLAGALGIYHQTVDPALQALQSDSTFVLPAMRARHAILGLQIGDGTPMARVELYHKAYSDLAAQTREFLTVGDGVGRARGADVITRLPVIAGVNSRIVYSYVNSVRSDPSSGIVAPAPADVTNVLTVIATKNIFEGATIGATFRYASGRPFTPVTSASRSDADGTWMPRYGAPGSDRLPAFSRLDLSASIFRVVHPALQMVGYTALTNVLDRSNVYTWRYSADYSTRYAVRSVFNRSLYFGSVVTFGH